MLIDTDLMPFGKYKGTAIGNVPAYYLLWLHKEHKASKEVEFYILMNWDVLQKEVDDWKRKNNKY